ncbi:MAG: polysaccharide deacetylase family protein, partial [Lachnospiraceae bacterium]
MKRSIRLFLGNAVMWIGVFLFGCLLTVYSKTNPISDHFQREEKEAFSIQEENYEKENLNSENNQTKVAYLTFDDGPSNHSEQLLDLLEEEGVKATFFVVAKEDVESERIYQRIVRDGHGLGLHSYSHVYEKIYSSPELFQEDLWKLKTFLYHKTGVSCNIYRFPGGSS